MPNPRGKWLGLVAISLGVSMIIVDATIVNVSVPQIIRDLGITSTDAQWVQEVYTLVFASLLLTSGRLADRVGRRRIFTIGVVVFVAASLLAALAGGGPTLIGSRVLQGVGGAMILPTSLSLINTTFRGDERGKAFAIWGSTIGGTAALGPLLGGWLTTSYSWRWSFAINLPIGLIVLAGTLVYVRESKDEQAGRGFDLTGAALSVLGLGAIVFGLIEGRTYGWFTRIRPVQLFGTSWRWSLSPVPIAFALGVLAVVAFVLVEVRRNRAGKAAQLDLSLLTIESFRNGNIAAAVVSLGEFGILFTLPLWFQNALGYSAFRTGLALLPLAAGSFAASGFGAVLARRRGARFVVRLGVVLEIVGIAGLGLVIAGDTPWWQPLPLLFVYGIGVGLATAQLTGVVLADVPPQRSGQASGLQSTSRQIGSALGIAILGTVLFGVLGGRLSTSLDRHGVPARDADGIVAAVKGSAGAAISGLRANPATAAAARDAVTAFSTAAAWTAWTAAAFLTLGLLATRRLGDAGRPTVEPPAREDLDTTTVEHP